MPFPHPPSKNRSAVGYQTTADILDEETKAKELRPRARKPIAERFFEGGWGKGVTA